HESAFPHAGRHPAHSARAEVFKTGRQACGDLYGHAPPGKSLEALGPKLGADTSRRFWQRRDQRCNRFSCISNMNSKPLSQLLKQGTPGPIKHHGEAVWSTHESVSGLATKGQRTNHICAVSSRLRMPDSERHANAELIARL